jgi:transcriptional regulator with PAS, ATPase and Fis domain
MQRIIQIALRVDQFDSTVFLMGESGVGKGIIARMIHKYSNRKNGSFIRVDCAGIPDSLIESELFGYEKGAFTGARPEGKPGFFELANEGTLFLDEIAEIPLGSQSKLLRFLEDHEIVRIGGTKPKKIDVRVIAATNRGIEEMVSSKLFRKDLYYRLNVVPIHIPPLRERQDDILPLIFHLLKKYNETYQTKKVLSPKAIDTIRKYDFPGNIRELANIIERLVVITEEDQIEGRDLGNAIEDYTPRPLHYNSFSSEGMSLKEALERCGNLIIDKAIKKYGSQREAAKILGVNQATISRRRKRFQLPNDVLMNKSDDILH